MEIAGFTSLFNNIVSISFELENSEITINTNSQFNKPLSANQPKVSGFQLISCLMHILFINIDDQRKKYRRLEYMILLLHPTMSSSAKGKQHNQIFRRKRIPGQYILIMFRSMTVQAVQ